jgi:sn-glycerol 3-phosphate transport system ATP-binding protein
VALARAIVAGHRLCLMDEPLSNLDAKLRHAVRQEIRALQRELGMTVLYVTHDQTEAMAMADRIVLMNAGRIEQVGTPAELYEQPATAFVATFVGSPPMALLPAAGIPAALRPSADATLAAELLVGVRPEAIRLAPLGADAFAGRVTEIEYLGAESLVYLATDAGPLIARLSGRPACLIGAETGLAWPPAAAVLFDRASGRRIDGATEAPPLNPSLQFAVPQ